MFLKHRGFLLLFIKSRGSRKLPEAFARPRSVTRSLDLLKFAAFAMPEAFNEQEGVIHHHNPVSSPFKIWSRVYPSLLMTSPSSSIKSSTD